ncbi:MAG: hypothetical protein ATN35_01535 [Epulopiscium sp. Nele67-Bin004]|nr:MAG: hypothetical protein ATN35_01535 [Epulopiscium sp. Nele67-Bin004]
MFIRIAQLIVQYVVHTLKVSIPLFVVYIVTRLIYIIFRKVKIQFKTEVLLSVTVFYFLCLYVITVGRPSWTFAVVMDVAYINIVPLVELLKLLEYGYITSFMYNVIGNIIWFVPIGILLPMQSPKYRNIFVIAKCGFLTSFSIELLQFIFGTGISDVDDLIINTCGAVVGYVVYKIVVKQKGYIRLK